MTDPNAVPLYPDAAPTAQQSPTAPEPPFDLPSRFELPPLPPVVEPEVPRPSPIVTGFEPPADTPGEETPRGKRTRLIATTVVALGLAAMGVFYLKGRTTKEVAAKPSRAEPDAPRSLFDEHHATHPEAATPDTDKSLKREETPPSNHGTGEPPAPPLPLAVPPTLDQGQNDKSPIGPPVPVPDLPPKAFGSPKMPGLVPLEPPANGGVSALPKPNLDTMTLPIAPSRRVEPLAAGGGDVVPLAPALLTENAVGGPRVPTLPTLPQQAKLPAFPSHDQSKPERVNSDIALAKAEVPAVPSVPPAMPDMQLPVAPAMPAPGNAPDTKSPPLPPQDPAAGVPLPPAPNPLALPPMSKSETKPEAKSDASKPASTPIKEQKPSLPELPAPPIFAKPSLPATPVNPVAVKESPEFRPTGSPTLPPLTPQTLPTGMSEVKPPLMPSPVTPAANTGFTLQPAAAPTLPPPVTPVKEEAPTKPAPTSSDLPPKRATETVPADATTRRAEYEVNLVSVRRGDSYDAIAKESFGDPKFGPLLRRYNDDHELQVGTVVKVPPVPVLRKLAGPAWVGTPGNAAPPERTYVTPRDGMSMWDVAYEVYGTKAEFRKVIDANRDRNPNLRFRAGERFRLPTE